MTKRIEDFQPFLDDNFIIFQKNGIIEIEKAPEFGEITFFYQDGKFSHLVRKETKK